MRAGPTRHTRKRARRGVTLIEVLLSLAIMVFAIVALGRLLDFGSDRALDTQLTTRGTRLAQAKMAEVEAGSVPLDGSASGDFDEEPGWSWTVTADPVVQGDQAVMLYLATVKVTRTLDGVPFEVTLAQHVLNPLIVGSAAQSEVTASTDSSMSGTSSSGTGTSPSTGGTSP